jgi:hypothetical protein
MDPGARPDREGRMTADDTPPARAADAAADPGHGQRELMTIGARALVDWTAEVITPRRRLVALGLALLVGSIMATLIRPVLARADGEDGATAGAILLGAAVGAAAATLPLSIWLHRAIRRHPSVTGSHPQWRDAALLGGAVDSRGRVTLAPGTAERVATESRRAIAASAVPLPGAVVFVLLVLAAVPTLALSGATGPMTWFALLYLLLFGSSCVTAARAAGPMALLRDAADAELALPASERPMAPPADPPHGSRLP